MDFDKAKENIQPLASGRNASLLQASLCADSAEKLLQQRRQYEANIHNYAGDDPLQPWYDYISWIEQSFPSGGKESGLDNVLRKCFLRFESEQRYNQDRRLIKLYLKFILNRKQPLELFQQLQSVGIGTMVADFYISWAYCHDLAGDARKADEVFKLGIACRAEPLQELQEAHQHFGYVVAQRIMFNDDEHAQYTANQQLEERRLALSTLRARRRDGAVGSIRTGVAVKSLVPGKLQMTVTGATKKKNDFNVHVLHDENKPKRFEKYGAGEAAATLEEKSVVRFMLETERDEENQLEPGPWNKAVDKKLAKKLFGKTKPENKLPFEILKDEIEEDVAEVKKEMKLEMFESQIPAFKYAANLVRKNLPQAEWKMRLVSNDGTKPRCVCIPHYAKMKLYADANEDYQPEELIAYNFFKRKQIQNAFTQKMDAIWQSYDINVPLRLYPGFAKESLPQKFDDIDSYDEPPINELIICPFEKLYVRERHEEYQYEELLKQKLRMKRRRTIMTPMDMDETVCFNESNAVEAKPMRRSCLPPKRMSIAPVVFKTQPTQDNQSGKRQTKLNDFLGAAATMEIIGQKEATAMTASTSKLKGFLYSVTMETADDQEATAMTASTSKLKGFLNAAAIEDEAQEKLATVSKLKGILKVTKVDLKSPLAAALPTAQDTKLQLFLNDDDDDDVNDDNKARESASSAMSAKEQAIATAEQQTFDIYEDTSTVPFAAPVTAKPADENMPIFKTPMLPVAKVSNNKQPFAIHTETDEIVSPPSAPTVSAFYDADETCSTQNFNIFLRSLPMSTPKINKVMPRQFDDAVPATETLSVEQKLAQAAEKSPTTIGITVEQPEISPTVLQASPAGVAIQQKQLSTILEISEHASTQGTHTTGATTKSTISSPETEIEATQAATAQHRAHHTELETVYEQSRENSLTVSKKEVAMAATPLEARSVITLSKPEQNTTATAILALTTATPATANKDVGLFSRLIEREDSVTALMALQQQPVQFQVERTETFNKLFSFAAAAQPPPDDMTDTNTLFANMIASGNGGAGGYAGGFQQDKTETIPKIALKPTIFEDSFSLLIKTPPPLRNNSEDDAFNFNEDTSLFGNNLKRFCGIQKPETGTKPKTSQYTSSMDCSNVEGSFIAASQPVQQVKEKSVASSILNASSKQQQENPQQPTAPTQFFELNAETDMFASKLSMSKNSTLLPKQTTDTKQQENLDDVVDLTSPTSEIDVSRLTQLNKKLQQVNIAGKQQTEQMSMFSSKSLCTTQELLSKTCSVTAINQSTNNRISTLEPSTVLHNRECDDMSIYFKTTPKTPKVSNHHWQDDDDYNDDSLNDLKTPKQNNFVRTEIDLNETFSTIDNICSAPNVSPFSTELKNAFVERVNLIDYIRDLPNCMLVHHVPRLKHGLQIEVKDQVFQVIKLIGDGAFGSIYCGSHLQKDTKVAFKQEKPTNYWEYYILLEVHCRLQSKDMFQAFMSVDYALIGNNCSVLISAFSQFGSLITVCNKVKKYTGRNVDEYIVMLLACELLEIIDHLHAMHIIHADIKADNILLMNNLSYPSKERALQLIDFGIAIDMKLFSPGQTFTYAWEDKAFQCVEMREGRAWTYQLDFYGLVSVIHVLLFGKYMELERLPNGFWMQRTHFPRYINKTLWVTVFETLLNVRDCNTMPNLQQLRAQLKEALEEKPAYLQQKIKEFNMALLQR